MAEDWSARQYLQFEDDRTRPSRDLLEQIPLQRARAVVDLGCGPGNSTELLAKRFAGSRIIGLDSSPDMLRKARERLPAAEFIHADLTDWMPASDVDVLFGNAVFQWVPDHPSVLKRLLGALPQGAALAIQMPDNTREPALMLMEQVARQGPWSGNAGITDAGRNDLLSVGEYYDLLKPLCSRLDIWHTVYNHVMDGHAGIVEWFKGSALRPYLNAIDAAMRDAFTAAYLAELAKAYPVRFDGKVLLRFPRLFIVAVR